jgi:hypothetical protein
VADGNVPIQPASPISPITTRYLAQELKLRDSVDCLIPIDSGLVRGRSTLPPGLAIQEARLEMSTASNKARAELLFKKEQRLRDGQIAAAAYEAEQQAIRQKTTRLRALRIARDAAENNKRKSSKMHSEETKGTLVVRSTARRGKEKADV